MSDAVISKEMSVVTATRNAIDVRKWVASKLMPREYGDTPQSIAVSNQTNVMVMSDEKLERLQAVRQRMLREQKRRVGVAHPTEGKHPPSEGAGV